LGWQNTCAGDDYPSAGAGGARLLPFVIAGSLLFVIARHDSAEAISLALNSGY